MLSQRFEVKAASNYDKQHSAIICKTDFRFKNAANNDLWSPAYK